MPGTAKLTLTIDAVTEKGMVKTRYVLRFLPSDPSIGSPAWRLTKVMADGSLSETRDVILTPTGPQCTCEDWVYRHQNDGELCKHEAALAALGLLDLQARTDR